MSTTTKTKATDLKAVAHRTIEAKKAIHDTVLYFHRQFKCSLQLFFSMNSTSERMELEVLRVKFLE